MDAIEHVEAVNDRSDSKARRVNWNLCIERAARKRGSKGGEYHRRPPSIGSPQREAHASLSANEYLFRALSHASAGPIGVRHTGPCLLGRSPKHDRPNAILEFVDTPLIGRGRWGPRRHRWRSALPIFLPEALALAVVRRWVKWVGQGLISGRLWESSLDSLFFWRHG